MSQFLVCARVLLLFFFKKKLEQAKEVKEGTFSFLEKQLTGRRHTVLVSKLFKHLIH